MKACLCKNPEDRPSAAELLKHKFIKGAKKTSLLGNIVKAHLGQVKDDSSSDHAGKDASEAIEGAALKQYGDDGGANDENNDDGDGFQDRDGNDDGDDDDDDDDDDDWDFSSMKISGADIRKAMAAESEMAASGRKEVSKDGVGIARAGISEVLESAAAKSEISVAGSAENTRAVAAPDVGLPMRRLKAMLKF